MSASSKKIIVLGDSGVGKTALIQRFVKETFTIEYRPTAGAVPYKKAVKLEGKTINLVIWDVAGHTLKLHQAFTSDADGAVLVCDMNTNSSFDSALQWHNAIKNKMGDIPVIVACNKTDIASANKCETLKNIGYRVFMTSARTGENVERVFMELIRSIN